MRENKQYAGLTPPHPTLAYPGQAGLGGKAHARVHARSRKRTRGCVGRHESDAETEKETEKIAKIFTWS